MKVTRTLHADVPPALAGVCKVMGFVGADIWRRFGALGTVGKIERHFIELDREQLRDKIRLVWHTVAQSPEILQVNQGR